MSAVVLDTSALVRLYVPDGPLPKGLERCIEAGWRGDLVLLCPELVLAEVGQVLLKKEQAGLLDKPTSSEILDGVLGLPIDYRGHLPYIGSALEVARATGTTVYDALFVAVAERHGAELVTADERLGEIMRSRTRRT